MLGAKGLTMSDPLRAAMMLNVRPYAALATEEVMHLASIAHGRHWALNWLCGHARENSWDETPTGT